MHQDGRHFEIRKSSSARIGAKSFRQFLARNRGDKLCGEYIGCAVNLENGIEPTDWLRALRSGDEWDDGNRPQRTQDIRLNLDDDALYRQAIEIEFRHQNWRNCASGTPFSST